LLQLLLVAFAASTFSWVTPVGALGQELKEFDSDYLESPPNGPELTQVEKEILRLTNEFRKQNGREALKPDKRLDKAAADFAAFMARTNKYGHDADGNRPAERLMLFGYDDCISAENIAYQMNSAGFSTSELANGFFEGWKKSPPHRENMLDPDLMEIGIAIGHAPDSDRYYAVQNFGRPQSASINFQVANHTTETVRYTVKGTNRGKEMEKNLELPPKTKMYHTRCRPATIDWGWTKEDDKMKIGDKKEFVITKTAAGYEVTR
jgi:uncharacterized protein YkwD